MDSIHNAALTRKSVITAMRACEQTAGVSVLHHGIMVRQAYLTLLDVAAGRKPAPDGWRLPDWAIAPEILHGQMDQNIVAEYQIHHDCGKPFVRTVDPAGRVHFPDHAAASERIWLGAGGDAEAATLMRMDMDAHLLKSDQVAEFARRPQAMTLLMTALAEVHANAEMFGGLDSDSFKIKAKHLAKRGKQVIALIQSSTTN